MPDQSLDMEADAAVAMRRDAERKGNQLLGFLVESPVARGGLRQAEKPAMVSEISFRRPFRLAEMLRVISK